MTRDNITLEALAKEATPYDQSVCGQGEVSMVAIGWL